LCHHRAKAAAAMAGQSLKAFLIDALQVAVDKDEKKRRR
jgi:predicted HicB family RNase H-like nuclease